MPAQEYNDKLSTPTPNLSATMHRVTDKRTDRQADNSRMPTADPTV